MVETLPAGSSATGIIASSGRAPSSQAWAQRSPARFGYGVRFLPVGTEDPRRRRADADGDLHAERRMTEATTSRRSHEHHDSRACRSSCWSARPARASPPSRASTSSRPRCSRRTSAAGWCRDDENDQAATKDAFEVLHFIAAKRLARGLLTVVDATNVQPEARKPLVALAREYHVLPGRHRARPAGAASATSGTARGPTATSART